MVVQRPLDVRGLDQCRKTGAALCCGLHLAHVLAHLGRHPRHPEVAVDIGLIDALESVLGGLQADGVAGGFPGEQPELIEAEAAVYCSLPHPDVVLLGAGEVGQSERECRWGYYPNLCVNGRIAAATAVPSKHVGLEDETDLRLAVPLDLGDPREGEYGLDN